MRVGSWEMGNLLREKNEEMNQKYLKARGVFKNGHLCHMTSEENYNEDLLYLNMSGSGQEFFQWIHGNSSPISFKGSKGIVGRKNECGHLFRKC